uniref:uncharacterized protein LOC122598801 isoform X2 n=1 Tax=Erigeron canadensis TaxID=72917 RepID=UPI001CB94710|nr:uncharacterized protein LOC122598801 isoform X2 [Erigeron canadensis]
MNRNPIFQVRKRKWKTVLFLLRKRKRRILINPSSFSFNDDDFAKQQQQQEPKFVENDGDFYDSFDGDNDDRDYVENHEEENAIFSDSGGLDENEEDVGDGEKAEVDIDKSAVASLVVVSKDREKDGGETPPDDDCCPICFENFNVASKTNCGHWFCANCILQYWTYRTVLQKCNCPICARPISKLMPEASLFIMQEAEVVEVLKNVQRYNRLFQGGINGVIRKVFEVPNVFKSMLCGLMDPDRFRGNYYAMRSLALMMSCIYNVSSFDFIPTDWYSDDVSGDWQLTNYEIRC